MVIYDANLYAPQSQSAAAGVAGNATLGCMTVRASVRQWLSMLPSHPALGKPQGFS